MAAMAAAAAAAAAAVVVGQVDKGATALLAGCPHSIQIARYYSTVHQSFSTSSKDQTNVYVI